MFRVKVSETKPAQASGTIITIGNYDGLHLGHMKLVQTLNSIAQADNLYRMLVTFEPLPREFFADNKQLPRLSRLSLLRDKYKVLYNDGACLIDELVVLRFNQQLAERVAQQFIRQVVITGLHASHIVVGDDFRYGKDAQGTIDDFKQYNLKVTTVATHSMQQLRVSSSLIRQFAQANNLTQLRNYLGRNLHYTSRVIHGNHLGRKYGVPTINLCLGKNKPAVWGIYVAYVYIENVRYNAVASIGKNPTVSDLDTYKLEAHLLDIDLNLYGKVATVEILEFLREERKFDNLELLFKQIHTDLHDAREYFIKGRA